MGAYQFGIVELALQLFFRPDGVDLAVADAVQVFAGFAAAAFGDEVVPVDAVAFPQLAPADGAEAYNSGFGILARHDYKFTKIFEIRFRMRVM